MGEPSRALVVEVGERAALQHALRLLVDGEQARGQRGHHVGLLAHELGGVKPPPPRLVETTPEKEVYRERLRTTVVALDLDIGEITDIAA